MIYPAMSSLLEKVDSRYTLVIATAKRARMLTNGALKLLIMSQQGRHHCHS